MRPAARSPPKMQQNAMVAKLAPSRCFPRRGGAAGPDGRCAAGGQEAPGRQFFSTASPRGKGPSHLSEPPCGQDVSPLCQVARTTPAADMYACGMVSSVCKL
ncbi:unnamed protein product [Prorocentrum cordatum]|uniref:Uncharacterized protein n=1 Tax=Prorocentrum cordatum TaxID=2364126 RepID=A0ABN9WGI1_9DINO|nr:unnamed protein product [Polarella glacialis]